MLIASIAEGADGVSEAVFQISRELHGARHTKIKVFSLASKSTRTVADRWGNIPVVLSEVVGPRSFGYSPALIGAMANSSMDILHVHGIWMYQSVASLYWNARTKSPYLISPHGMLDSWALSNSHLRKKVAARLYEHRHLNGAACIHALCEAEYNSIREFGLRNPVCIIPSGVTLAPWLRPEPPDWKKALSPDTRVLLFLGRLHPKKGVHHLIPAWREALARVDEDRQDWKLIIAGPGQRQYVDRLRQLISENEMADKVQLVGPQYGAAKEATLAWSQGFVLPSHSEGMPMSVLEAWAHSLPTVYTPQCNLPEGVAKGAAISIEADKDGIAAGLEALLRLPEMERRLMGQAGRHLASSEFSWVRSGLEFERVYRWIARSEPMPSCVRLD
jgi:glycosyltransferase involved in cell wall biosynthesis